MLVINHIIIECCNLPITWANKIKKWTISTLKPYKDKVRKVHYSNNVQKIRTSQLWLETLAEPDLQKGGAKFPLKFLSFLQAHV